MSYKKCKHATIWIGRRGVPSTKGEATWCSNCGAFRMPDEAEWMIPTIVNGKRRKKKKPEAPVPPTILHIEEPVAPPTGPPTPLGATTVTAVTDNHSSPKITARETAKILGKHLATLSRWRKIKFGPEPIYLSPHKVVYDRTEVLKFKEIEYGDVG